MKRHTLELFFESQLDAMAAGYPDALPIDADLPEVGCFALLSFECQSFEYLGVAEDGDLSVDVEILS